MRLDSMRCIVVKNVNSRWVSKTRSQAGGSYLGHRTGDFDDKGQVDEYLNVAQVQCIGEWTRD